MRRTRARARSLDGKVGFGIGVGLCVASVIVIGALCMVNYVPDSLSTSQFGLAVPLFRDGYLQPTVLFLVGSASSFPGVIARVLLMVAAVVIGVRLAHGQGRAVGLAAVVIVAVHLGLLAGLTKKNEQDLAAVGHLKSVWAVPSAK